MAAIAHAAFDCLFFPAGQLGDVVDRTTHSPGTVEECRRPPDEFHPIINPGIHRACGTAVAHSDAVVELGDLILSKTTVRHKAAEARVCRCIDPGHGIDDILGVLGAAFLNDRTVCNTHRCGRFAGSQTEA